MKAEETLEAELHGALRALRNAFPDIAATYDTRTQSALARHLGRLVVMSWDGPYYVVMSAQRAPFLCADIFDATKQAIKALT